MNGLADVTKNQTFDELLARVRACTVCAAYLPMPHRSPRNRGWLKLNPWFETEVLPVLRERVGSLLSTGDNGAAHELT